MKKQEAIETLKELNENYFSDDFDEANEAIDLAITALTQQLTNGWILVSERLPEEKEFYIFQTKGGKVHEWYYEDEKIFEDNIHDEEYLFKINQIIAWQSLPEKYEEYYA